MAGLNVAFAVERAVPPTLSVKPSESGLIELAWAIEPAANRQMEQSSAKRFMVGTSDLSSMRELLNRELFESGTFLTNTAPFTTT